MILWGAIIIISSLEKKKLKPKELKELANVS